MSSTPQIGQFVNIPTGENVDKVKAAFDEIADALMKIRGFQAQIKDVKQMLKEDYEMTPKSINAIAKMNDKQNAEEFFEENDELQGLYETLFGII